jgi:hypothetical protein
MPDKGASPKGLTPATSPRGNVTPPGHKNVRVFVSTNLHFRLLANSAASEMSLNDFVVAWLERATPLGPLSSPQGGTPTPDPQRQNSQEQAPGHGPGQRPPSGQDQVDRPGAAHFPEAKAPSRPDHALDPARSRSATTVMLAQSQAGPDKDKAEAERTSPR